MTLDTEDEGILAKIIVYYLLLIDFPRKTNDLFRCLTTQLMLK
jgi:hypothetical protein